MEDLADAEMLWVDCSGAYLRVRGARPGGAAGVLRLPFPRQVQDVRGVRSALTMMAQVGGDGMTRCALRCGAPTWQGCRRRAAAPILKSPPPSDHPRKLGRSGGPTPRPGSPSKGLT